MTKAIIKNKRYSEIYHQKNVDQTEIPKIIFHLIKKSKINKILDLGCGDGGIISAITKKFPNKKIIGIDISQRRIKDLKRKYPKYSFLCKDVVKTGLPSKSFDLAISTQVIEHLKDDKNLLKEIFRLLKCNGYLYISSVVKKTWAIYKYRNNKKFVLDPTHEYEYKSKEEFLNLLKKHNFKVCNSKIIITKRNFLGLTIPIPGFYIIEVLCKK